MELYFLDSWDTLHYDHLKILFDDKLIDILEKPYGINNICGLESYSDIIEPY